MKRYTHSIFLVAVVMTLATLIFFLIQNRMNVTASGNEPVRYRAVNAGDGTLASDPVNQTQKPDRLSSAIPLETYETLLDLYS